MLYRRSIAPLAACLTIILACNGADLVLPDEGQPAAIAVVQGGEQIGRVGEPLPEPLVARVTDTRGRPVVDVPVALLLEDGAEAEVAPAGARTDTDGTAAFQIVLGGRVGAVGGQVVVTPASGDEPAIAAPVRFTAVSADAAGIALAGGDGQSGPAGSVLPEPLVVQAADVFGNPIPGVPIAWEVEGGGSVSATVTETDADGRAMVERTLGASAGVQHTRAGAAGLVGSPVTFSHTATAGSAARLEEVSGNGQSAVAGTPLANDLVVRLLDPSGNPVAGTAVAWVVGRGGGTVAPETGPTDEQGIAATRWTLGPQVGAQTVTAVVSGVGVVEFTGTAVAGTPPGLRLVTQPAVAAERGLVLSRQPVVQLVDPSGAELREAGVAVTVSVAAGGGRARGTLTRSTGPDGRAVFTDLALEGPAGRYTLAFGAAGYSGAVSDPIELARASTATTIQSDTPDPSAPGAVVRVVFTVTAAGGRPAGVVSVESEDGATCQASASAGACSIALTRVGAQRITAAYEGDAEFAPSTDTEDHMVEVPPAPALVLATQPSPTSPAGVPFGRQPVIQLRDGGGNDLRTAGVVVTAGIASGSGTLIGQTTRATDGAGRAAFEGLGITGATGPHVLRFTADGFTPVASNGVEVEPAPTTLRIESDAPDPSDPGATVQVTYTVTSPAGTPPGSVTVTGGGASCTATVADGGCALVLGTPGSHTLTAQYAGGGGFAPASDTEPHTVSDPAPAGPSASASSVSVEPATLEVGGRATIRVVVRDDAGRALSGIDVALRVSGTGNEIDPATARTNGSGEARFTLRSTVAEAKTVSATAAGVTLAEQPAVTFTRTSSTTRIVSDEPDPSAPGQPVEVRVRVESSAATPTGAVTVTSSAGERCELQLAGGEGSCTLAPAAAGQVTLTAEYAGDQTFEPSLGTAEHRVEAPAARILLLRTQPSEQAVPGEPLARQPEIQLAVEGGGEVRQGGVVVRAELASGGGTLTGTTSIQTQGDGRARFDDLALNGSDGDYTLVFSADGFGTVTSNVIRLSRRESSTEITGDDPDPSAPGETFTVRVRVRGGGGGAPSGMVSVTAEGTGTGCSATLDGNGEGSCDLVLAGEGEFTLVAEYPGDEEFAPSTSGGVGHRVEGPGPPP